MENIKELSTALKNIQSRVIGLFRANNDPDRTNYMPVINDDNGVLECVSVGSLLGLQTLTIGSGQGRYVKFPVKISKSMDKVQFPDIQETLSSMMSDPLMFHTWYKENVYPGKVDTTEREYEMGSWQRV